MSTPPATPVLDVVLQEAKAYVQWWWDAGFWHNLACFVAMWLAFMVIAGGIRAFWMAWPDPKLKQ